MRKRLLLVAIALASLLVVSCDDGEIPGGQAEPGPVPASAAEIPGVVPTPAETTTPTDEIPGVQVRPTPVLCANEEDKAACLLREAVEAEAGELAPEEAQLLRDAAAGDTGAALAALAGHEWRSSYAEACYRRAREAAGLG